MPSLSEATAVKVVDALALVVSGPVSVTLGTWLPSVTVPVKSSSSGMSSPMPQSACLAGLGERGSSSASREQTLSTTTR